MIQLWSTWNLGWFISAYFKLVPFNGPLKTSIIITSLIGGYLIYIYPRKVSIILGRYKIIPSYKLLVLGDICCHQFPMAYLIYNTVTNNSDKLLTNDSCGYNIIYPVTGWITYNAINYINMDKLYGIKFKNLMISSAFIFTGYSIFYHLKK